MKSLVTVGIPTFNRPFGLERTLRQISNQTYKNIEILVSDNASTDPAVKEILEEFALKDSRIKYVIQPENIGMIPNFQYVYHHSSDSEFFMWAADDDEWSPEFIETCVQNIGDSGTAMTGFYRHLRFQGTKDKVDLFEVHGKNDNLFTRLGLLTLMMPCHSIIYGLHRKNSLDFLVNDPNFDDEYFLFKQMADHGIVTIPQSTLYTAGIDSDIGYAIKEFDDNHAHKYGYKMIMKHMDLIYAQTELSNHQKLELMRLYIIYHIDMYILHHKKPYYSEEDKTLAKNIREFLSHANLSEIEKYSELLFNLSKLNK